MLGSGEQRQNVKGHLRCTYVGSLTRDSQVKRSSLPQVGFANLKVAHPGCFAAQVDNNITFRIPTDGNDHLGRKISALSTKSSNVSGLLENEQI